MVGKKHRSLLDIVRERNERESSDSVPNPAGRTSSLARSSSKRKQGMSVWPGIAEAGLPWDDSSRCFAALPPISQIHAEREAPRVETGLTRRTIQSYAEFSRFSELSESGLIVVKNGYFRSAICVVSSNQIL